MNRRIPVIMYHDVFDTLPAGAVWFDTTTKQLREQFEWMHSHDITPISLDQLYQHLINGAEVPRDSIVLTFDDNGEGFYQYVVPLLRDYKFPAAMFVHTSSPTLNKPGRPHMTWDQLRELTKEPLVTIGAHSVTHPLDMTMLSEDAATKEIAQSKADLEKELGKKIDYFAYPNGKFNNALQKLTEQAGFKMAFTIDTGLAEESPSLYAIHRYERQKLAKAWEDREKSNLDAPADVTQIPFTDAPVQIKVGEFDGLKIAIVQGGKPTTVLSHAGRQGVTDFVQQSNGVAGINGGFFAMAGLQATSNVMIGPSENLADKTFVPDPSLHLGDTFIKKLRNRPIVMWGPKKLAIAPYQAETMNNEAVYRQFMPDMTDLFLAGAWIVHEGHARTQEQILSFASKDTSDPRRRAFLGITSSGVTVIGASLQTCSTERLAEAAAAAGVQEAVLLDSGFSTSLVYNGRIIVTGHTAQNLPSRPVPHAIVINGTLDLTGADAMIASAAEGARSPADIEGEQRARERRRLAAEEAKRRAQEAAELEAAGGGIGVTPPPGDDSGEPGPFLPPPEDDKTPKKPGNDSKPPTKPDPKAPDPSKPPTGTTTGGKTTGGAPSR